MDYRKTEFYKSLDLFTACKTVEWSEDATQEEQLTAWQWLLDTGHCWMLQGWYGRTVMEFLDQHMIKPAVKSHSDYYGNKVVGTKDRA